MAVPHFLRADYLQAFKALMPRGRAWSRDEGSVMVALLRGLSGVYERTSDRAAQLIAEAFPLTTYELLPDWEASLGLPDPCQGSTPTISSRRNQVVARFAGDGGQSKNFIIDFAAKLGFTITITEFRPFTAGMTVGLPISGVEWAHVWQVNAPQFTVDYFKAGVSVCGEPLARWGDTVLQCELQRIAPAHSYLIFSYA